MLRSTMQRVDTDKVTAELQGSVYVHAALAAGRTNTLTNQKHDIYKLDVSNGNMHAVGYCCMGSMGWEVGTAAKQGIEAQIALQMSKALMENLEGDRISLYG